MATAVAIQETVARYYRNGEFESPQLGIVCFSLGDEADDPVAWSWHMEKVRHHHGAFVEDVGPPYCVVFSGLADAVRYANAMQDRFKKRIRIGVNLDAFKREMDPQEAFGSNFAKRMLEACEPGEICISALAEERITSRRRYDIDPPAEPKWRAIIFATLQCGGLIGYLVGWGYLIYLQHTYLAEHGEIFCWPDWLCE